jgi:hypothetical protein
MATTIRRATWGIAVLALLTCATAAQDSRLALFDTYNTARTYQDVQPLVSGVLAQQYAAIASRDARQVPDILAQQQFASYRARIVEIDDANSLLVLEHVQPKLGHDTSSQAYLLMKNPAGRWTLANRMMPDSIIMALWTRHFNVSEFAQSASCVIDGREFLTRSALAIRRGDSIAITLYPFDFTPADLSYWRQMSGLPADAGAGESHFSRRIPTVCRVVVKVSDAGRPSLLNVGFDDQTSAPARSTLWQPPQADVSRLELRQDVIELTTAGAVGADRTGFRWNVNIKVPIWQQGL